MLKKTIKYVFVILMVIIVLLNLTIIVSGRFYLYKGLWNTYLKGHSGPSATEYLIFENRKISALNPVPLLKSKHYNNSVLSNESAEKLKAVKAFAFVVIQNDSLLHEQYWDEFSDTSHTNSFSIAKTYCSILLGCALKDGYIKNLDEPVAKYISEFSEGDKAKITLRHLVTMTSGIDFNESYINPFAYPAEGYYGSNILWSSCRYPASTEPGKIFKYLSGNSALLGICITKAVGKPLAIYLSDRLWKDVECEHSAWWSLDKKDGYEKGFCCINSNATDFARIGMLYLNYGKWKGKQIVDSEYVTRSIEPSDCLEEDGSPNHTYGYSWWLTNYKGENIFYARGILGQYVICLPSKKMVIVKLGRKRPNPGKEHTPENVGACIDAALALCK